MRSFRDFLKQIGQKVRWIRTHLGWTQKEASEKIGMPPRRYQDVEAGKANLTLRTVYRFAKVFRRSPKEFI